MPPWLIAVLAVWLLVLPLGALAWSVWKLRGEIAATEDESGVDDGRRFRAATPDELDYPERGYEAPSALTTQRANPRGVGRHDWPL
jgi:hypothetical protein